MSLDTPSSFKPSSIVIAFDVGRKKTGVAIGNYLTRGARPLSVIYGSRSEQLKHIDSLIQEWRPTLLVVGLPTHMDGTAHAMTKYCRYFSTMLCRRYDIKTELVDERLSTQVTGAMGNDADAASVILQAWWDRAFA